MLPSTPYSVPPELYEEFAKIYRAIHELQSGVQILQTPSTATQTTTPSPAVPLGYQPRKYIASQNLTKDMFLAPAAPNSTELVPSSSAGLPVLGICPRDITAGVEFEVFSYGLFAITNYSIGAGMLFKSDNGQPQLTRSDQVIGIGLGPNLLIVLPQPPVRMEFAGAYFS